MTDDELLILARDGYRACNSMYKFLPSPCKTDYSKMNQYDAEQLRNLFALMASIIRRWETIRTDQFSEELDEAAKRNGTYSE